MIFANFVKKHVNKNELSELSKKVKATSTKGLIKDLIDKINILNGAKYCSSGNIMECQKKILKM